LNKNPGQNPGQSFDLWPDPDPNCWPGDPWPGDPVPSLNYSTIALSNGAIADPLRPPFSTKWGFHMPPTYVNGHISATGGPIHFMFDCRVGFSGTVDWTALFTVRTNPRWRRPPSWKNFKWPYLRNRSSDPLHVWLWGGVFRDGGCNGAIFDWNKFKMAAAAI